MKFVETLYDSCSCSSTMDSIWASVLAWAVSRRATCSVQYDCKKDG